MDFGGNYDWVRTCYERILGNGMAYVSNGNFRGECVAVVYHWLAGKPIIDVHYCVQLSEVDVYILGLDLLSTDRQLCNKARIYPSIVLTPTNWWPTR